MRGRWLRFFRRAARDRELAREIESYLAIETDDNIARGHPPDEARARALKKFGNVTRVREEVYLMNSMSPLDSLWQDLRYAGRLLRRDKVFAVAAIVSLALGIGANTAIFQLLETVRLRALPVAAPDQLVEVRIPPGPRTGQFNGRRPMVTFAQWEELQKHQQVFSGVLAWSARRFNIARGGEMQFVEGLYVSGSFFDVLGVRALRGRTFTAADDVRGCTAPGAVISHAFWQRQFGGRDEALGARLWLDDVAYEVIGVTPPSFFGVDVGRQYDVAIPLCAEDHMAIGLSRLDRRDAWWLAVLGRLAPGVTVAQAASHLDALSLPVFAATVPPTYQTEDAKNYRAFRWTALPAASGVSGLRTDFGDPLVLLLAITGLVLVIACANLANLLLARASVREREIALRLAIGAARPRIIRQLIVESVLLAAIGAAAGALLAGALGRLLLSVLATSYAGLFVDLSWNWRVLGFTMLVAALAVLLFGLAPAWRATAIAPGVALRNGARGTIGSAQRTLLRRGLVVTQVALSLVLLVGALLFTRTFYNLMTEEVGFDPDVVVTAMMRHRDLPARGAEAQTVRGALRERLAGVSDVVAAAQADVVPLAGTGYWNEPITIDDTSTGRVVANFNRVSADYFAVLGLPIVMGRNFTERDALGAATVAIVSQSFVQRFIPDGSPLGKRVRQEPPPGTPPPVLEIVGVVPDTKLQDVREAVEPMVYVASTQEQEPGTFVQYVVRTRGPAERAIAGMTAAVAAVNPAINLEFRIVGRTIRNSLVRERLMAALSTAFGLLAGILAAIGVYGVMAYTVALRASEIGVRMAMGAARRDVVRMVLSEAGRLVIAGVIVGTALALAAARSAGTLLFRLEPSDPVTLALAGGMLLIIGLAAGLVPARRAARLDPIIALRSE